MSDVVSETQAKLSKVSPSFCLAKWTSVTLHLETGTTHSCHHPVPHKIPLTEIATNPAALHNTKYKLLQREKMLKGERPSECDYCWKIEDLDSNHLSDRILKSAADWSIAEYDKILSNPLDMHFKPKYLEVSFSNKCQFKCMYCSADYSTTWEEELKKFGSYRTKAGAKYNEMFDESENPYIKAFWDWWPKLSEGLHTFRITGGEPLLSPNTFKIIDSLLEKPQPNLTLAINTNLGAPSVLIEKFLNSISLVEEKKSVKEVSIFASIDAHAEKAEYIRSGLKANYFWENVENILKRSQLTKITIMCTFNALSVTSFGKMFNTVFELNKKYSNSHRVKPILIDIAYLRNPEYQSVKVLTKDFNEIFKKTIQQVELKDFVIEGRKNSYYHLEIIKLKRLYDWMQEPISVDEKNKLQRAFYSFFSQMDERRGLDFCKTFPEMESFWKICKKEYTGYKAFKKFQDFFKMEKIKDFSIENISERYKHYRYRLQLAVRSIPLVGPLLLKLYYFTFYVLNKYTNKFKYKK